MHEESKDDKHSSFESLLLSDCMCEYSLIFDALCDLAGKIRI